MATRKITYGAAMKRLEEIMDGIENNRFDIDELVPVLKEAKELIAYCNDKLYKVDKEKVDKEIAGIISSKDDNVSRQ